MGFSGGGSNITKAHTHDSNIVQDGGSLAANVTQFGLAAGSVLYSDGSNIQELAVGSATDVLTVNGAATAPEWVAAAGGGFTTSNILTDTISSNFTTTSATYVDSTLSFTLSNEAGGNAMVTAQGQWFGQSGSEDCMIAIGDAGSALAYSVLSWLGSGDRPNFSTVGFMDTDGQTASLMGRTAGSGTLVLQTNVGTGSVCGLIARELY